MAGTCSVDLHFHADPRCRFFFLGVGYFVTTVTTHSKSKDGRPALHEGAVSFFHPSSALLCRLPRLLGGWLIVYSVVAGVDW